MVYKQPLPYLYLAREVLGGARIPYQSADRWPLAAEPFAAALESADDVLARDVPFHIHFSDIAFANRNETKHLAYGEGTLRAEPLRDALGRFERPATVISESPDEASSQAIRAILVEGKS